MALNRIREEKQNKLFMKGDIAIYIAITIAIILIFFSVYLGINKNEVNKISVSFKDLKILEYDFNTGLFDKIDETYYTIEEIENGFKIKFQFNERDYNIIEINNLKREVIMVEANCSLSKECTNMRISKASDSIICVPHFLIINAHGKSKIKDPQLG